MSIHVRRRKNGKRFYEVRWREHEQNKSRSFDLKPDAAAFDAELRRLRQAGELDIVRRAHTVTLAEYASEWWDRYATERLALSTQQTYALQLDKRILPRFGNWPLKAITPREVERWVAAMSADHVGDPTIRYACAVLQSIMKRAVVDELVPRNPVALAAKPRQQRTREPYTLNPVQVEQIRAQLPELRDRTLVSLLAYSGPRPESEALPLPWSAITKTRITYRATKRTGGAGTTGKPRLVRLLEPLSTDLTEWRLASRNTSPLVFPDLDDDGRGHTWDNWRDRVFRPAAIRAGLPADIRPRDLRGSFASLLIWEGQTVVEVAKQLGHSVEQCSRHYLGVLENYDPEKRTSAVESIRAARQHVNATQQATG